VVNPGSPFVVVSNLVISLPLLVVWLGGILLAIAYWPRYPRVAALAICALALACLSLFVSALTTSALLPVLVQLRGGTVRRLESTLLLAGIVRTLLDAFAWGLLVAAVFVGRGQVEAQRDQRNE
jgi:hypothetical protein